MIEAVDYYNHQSPGLGYEFAAEVRRGFKRIKEHPSAWPVFFTRFRRYLTDRFPFAVIYSIRNETIIVAGIMHLRQDPQHWKDREERK